MKGKLISFLILPSVLFAFLIIFSAAKAFAINTAPTCVASTCGTSVGTKEVPVYGTVCDEGCPTAHFEWTERVYGACPVGYSVYHEDKCKKDNNPDKGRVIDRSYVNQTYTVDVVYEKSNDPHKCHRPSDSTLENLYGMDTNDIRNDFKHDNGEWKNSVQVNCHQELTGYNTVACDDATVIPCEETCPTACGLESSQVPDGNGGLKTCPATSSCSTHRWCVLQEDDSYLAQAISDSEENPEGKPWVTGMDRYCEYAYEQCSITNPSYGTWGDWTIDNEDDSMLVEKRTVTYYDSVDSEVICSTTVEKQVMERPLCEYDGATYADDPLCVPEDEGDVLGETDEDTDGDVLGVTDVVTADTAGGLDSSAYILQFVLVLITSVLFVSVAKEYLKK